MDKQERLAAPQNLSLYCFTVDVTNLYQNCSTIFLPLLYFLLPSIRSCLIALFRAAILYIYLLKLSSVNCTAKISILKVYRLWVDRRGVLAGGGAGGTTMLPSCNSCSFADPCTCVFASRWNIRSRNSSSRSLIRFNKHKHCLLISLLKTDYVCDAFPGTSNKITKKYTETLVQLFVFSPVLRWWQYSLETVT